MPRVLIEACVEEVASAVAAEEGGAGRIELCASLDQGGLTPGDELIAACLDRVSLPVVVMIRSRPGGFVLEEGEPGRAAAEVRRIVRLGASGIVFGALTRGGAVDDRAVEAVVSAAGGVPVTFHRAFDEIADQPAALERLVRLGVRRVLTSGGAPSAWDGAARIAALVGLAGGRIGVLAGGSVRAHNAAAIVARTGAQELHSRTTRDPDDVRALVHAANAGARA
ncbi:MAG TPA: copper homeostasis protein CutC [Gemmatimonadales bacterium]|nr:copper homeostasis protein CutC [Gemmatimonadales bacterium]